MPTAPTTFRIGAFARIAGVTIRALHHYDRVGLLRPTRGKIEVLGREVSAMSERELLPYRRQVGFVFQEGCLLYTSDAADE